MTKVINLKTRKEMTIVNGSSYKNQNTPMGLDAESIINSLSIEIKKLENEIIRLDRLARKYKADSESYKAEYETELLIQQENLSL